MAIQIPAGAFRTSPLALGASVFAQALAGALTGKREREETEYERRIRQQQLDLQERSFQSQLEEAERRNAYQQLKTLVELHGKDVVDTPQFQSLYEKITGRPYPTYDEEETVTVSPGTSPREEGGEVVPGTPPVVEKRIKKVPLPLGGRQTPPPTLGQLGIVEPGHPLANLTTAMAKEVGIDLDKLIFPTPKTEAQVMGQLLLDAVEGRLTPEKIRAIQLFRELQSSGPQTMEGLAVRLLERVGYDVSKLPPFMQEYIKSSIQAKKQESVEQEILRQIAEKGYNSLTPGQKMIWQEKISRPPTSIGQVSWNEYLVRLARGQEPWPTDPRALALIQRYQRGDTPPVDRVELRRAESYAIKLRGEWAAAVAALRAKVDAVAVRNRLDPSNPAHDNRLQQLLLRDPEYNDLVQEVSRKHANYQTAQQYADHLRQQMQEGLEPAPGARSTIPEPPAPTPSQWARQFVDDLVSFVKKSGKAPTKEVLKQLVLEAKKGPNAKNVPSNYWAEVDRIIGAMK